MLSPEIFEQLTQLNSKSRKLKCLDLIDSINKLYFTLLLAFFLNQYMKHIVQIWIL